MEVTTREPFTMIHKSAQISECERYRYRLIRGWSHSGEIVTFCMLNPSKADANDDDPTIRRCMGFAKRWGFCGIEVVNLFAYRATNPRDLPKTEAELWGPGNEGILRQLAGPVVVGWGSSLPKTPAAKRAAELVKERAIELGQGFFCLGKTKGGEPRHPLFVSYTTPLEAWPK